MAEKAFLSYVTISTGNGSSELTVIDAKTGDVLGLVWAPVNEGYGSSLAILCVNGRAPPPTTTRGTKSIDSNRAAMLVRGTKPKRTRDNNLLVCVT